MSELTHPVTIGKYQCILRIGQGGMGEVFLGVARGPGGFSKLNVIKRLRHDVAADESFIEMFLNEARLAGRLNHPNIVQTKEVGVEGDAHFMVMEYLEGQTLFYVLRKLRRGEASSAARLGGLGSTFSPMPESSRPSHLSRPPESRPSYAGPPSRPSRPSSTPSYGGPVSSPSYGGPSSSGGVRSRSMHLPHAAASGFSLAMHLQVISDVLAGLHYAHEAQDFAGTPLNLIHRDVAPSNIFITYEGQVKVLDFGIAKAADSGNATRAGVFKGKVAYMAPEQFVNANIDRRCDIFAVGATLWEAAAGTRLWKGLSDVEIFRHLAEGHIPPPSTVAPNANPRLEAICMRALAFNRDQRYETAQELRADLDALIDELGRPTREEIGLVVSDMFTAERAQTNALIEAKLRSLRSQEAAAAGRAAAEGYVAVAPDPTVPAAMSPIAAATAAAAVEPSIPPPQKSSRKGLAVAAIVVLGGVGVGGALLSKGSTSNAPPSTPASASAVSSVPLTSDDAAPQAPPAPAALSLQISATPRTAILYVDDVRLPRNPHIGTIVPDAQSHRLRVEAPGYRSQTEFVQFAGTEPIELHVDLVPEKAAKPTWVPPRKLAPSKSGTTEAPKATETATATTPPSAPPKPAPSAKPKPFEIDVTSPYKK
ncbi:serine/threonine protein kinase [Pendulispora rubella]|uniref:Serine/threonine protein kinase n=1 Tax=Pendulispora rubella TaxID=2741070 RepID=A0ABZ2LK63_9BACT